NKSTGEYIWDKNVTSEKNTPLGFKYIGKDNQSIVRDLFGGSRFLANTSDLGTIDFQDFNNKYSASGYAAMYMSARTNMDINLRANVTENFNDNSKVFNGIDINVVVSGKVVAPYPDMNMNLF